MADFFATRANTIAGLDINANPNGWGPVSGEPLDAFDDVPYAHFDKKDKCNRPADFTAGQSYYQQLRQSRFNQRRDEFGIANADFSYRHDALDDSTFQLVDTSKTQTKCKCMAI